MEYIVEMRNITKTFPGIKANDNVTLQLKKGEVHALLGENGAGKSTLMSILFGLYQPDSGKIFLDGNEVHIHNPNDANKNGIGMVHQHFKLIHNFTVLENIVLGYETTKFGFMKYEKAREKISNLSKLYKLDVNLDSLISDISVGMQQRVEILKMLYRDSNILIFDEPTAVLTPQEITELMGIIRNLVKEGKSVILITHKLNEIKQVSDRCTVLRKGKYIGTVDVKNTSVEEMAEMMVGRTVNFKIDKKPVQLGDSVLKIEHLSVFNHLTNKNIVNDVSFEVHKGEILCVAGIEGNGQTQLVEAITGLHEVSDGKVILNDLEVTQHSVRYRNEHGISHIPEDRHKHGLVLDYTLEENLILETYYQERYNQKGFLKFDEIRTNANTLINQFDIRSGNGPVTLVRSMSGGNQQKAIVAREISRDTDLLIAVQPTRGLDVGAIEYIHKQLIQQRDNGKAVLLISLELEEVMNISDRIIVMYEGEIVGELDPNNVSENELGLYMAGSKRSEK